MDKIEILENWMRKEKRVVVAFSGGIDSAVLAIVARNALKDDMLAVTGDSETLPSRDRVFVTDFCKRYSLPHRFVRTREFEDKNYTENPENRCYYCKQALFAAITDIARSGGFASVLDGTNASDLSGHRPGYRAIEEFGAVKAPYIELGITKPEIRELAGRLCPEIKDKPSSACLASRIPWGTPIRPRDLRRVDEAENLLRDLGLTQVRVRHHGEVARIQCIKKEFALAIERRTRIEKELKKLGYKYVTVDLNCYDTSSPRPTQGADGAEMTEEV